MDTQKIICKISIIQIIIYLIYISSTYSPLAIPELHIYVPWSFQLLLSNAIIFGWFMLPLRKYFRCGGIIEVLYFLFPIMFLCNIAFAQYHVIISIIFSIAVVVFILKYRGRWILVKSRNRKEIIRKKICARKCLLCMSLVLLFPSVYMFCHVMSSPLYSGTSFYMEDPSINDENYQLRQLLEYNKDTLSYLNVSKWKKLSEQDRIDVLKTIADIEATYLNIEQVEVVTENLEYFEYGSFSVEENKIKINRYYLNDPDISLECILHEIHHAFQVKIVCLLDAKASDESSGMYYGDVRKWKENLEGYTSSYDDGYYVQAVEVSARKYASEEIKIYKEFIGD